MSYTETLFDAYKSNKKLIYFYLGLVLAMSMLFFFGSHFSNATDSVEITSWDSAITFGAGTFTLTLNMLLVNLFPTIDPCIGFLISTVLAVLEDYALLPAFMGTPDFGLLSTSWIFRIVIVVWGVLSLLPRYFGVSQIFGLAIEDINDKYIGLVVLLVNMIPQFFNLVTVNRVAAADLDSVSGFFAGASATAFSWFCCFLLLTGTLLCYAFIRTFLFFIDIIKMPIVSIIPGASGVTEAIKSISCVVMAFLSFISPALFLYIYAVLLIVSIVFFRIAYKAVSYFKNIYILPVVHKLFDDTKVYPLIAEKLPKKVKSHLNGREIKIAIPTYLTKSYNRYWGSSMHNKYWLVLDANDQLTLCIKKGRKINEFPLIADSSRPHYIHKGMRYIEIYNLKDNAKSTSKWSVLWGKQLHLVISNDYSKQYDQLSELLKNHIQSI